ncbi:dihydroorotate dehydrogenase [Ceraceosorus bombacis]|uniref:Dihydroorotate dehydrogenase (quinone), mitochondrial n=1 Tax=Ceraceosorus bombacis TaxID=401625 RepID=A0A0P1BFQ2_9BASI|nr:dihydroorotate dehydrogenase [Ceraceosorus bombacis]
MSPLRASLRLRAPAQAHLRSILTQRVAVPSTRNLSRTYATAPQDSSKSTSQALGASQDAQELAADAANLKKEQVKEEVRSGVAQIRGEAEEAARAAESNVQSGSDKVQAVVKNAKSTYAAGPSFGGSGGNGSSGSGSSVVSKFTSLLKWTLIILGGSYVVAYHLDSRSAIHRWVAIPVLQLIASPEEAQKLAIKLLSMGVMPRDLGTDDEVLKVELFGKQLSNPIGLAAGFDKQGEAIDGLLNLGWGMVEIGSVTPLAQPGNDLPRYFRLENDRAAINRFGFNSDGHDAVLHRLRERLSRWLHSSGTINDVRVPITSGQAADEILARNPDIGPALLDASGLPRSTKPGQLLGINLGKNKSSAAEDVSDYEVGVQSLGRYADFLVINISSPNTPGLRALQRYQTLTRLLSAVVKARDDLPTPRAPLLVKIAPDLSTQELHDVADAALSAKIDGLIISNTTVSRPETLKSAPHLIEETGGLSGPPLKPLALRALQIVRERAGDKLPLVGCGGISSGADALDFARAGASAVELYTSFGYEGVGHPRRIKDELTSLLKAQNTTWAKSIGAGLPSREDAQGKLPSGEKEIQVVGGAAQRLDSVRAGIKGELEGLRKALGGSAMRETRAAAFRPDPKDSAYVSLLDRVHAVLGTDYPSHEADSAGDILNASQESLSSSSTIEALKGASRASTQQTTRAQQLQKDLEEALLDASFISAGLPSADKYSIRPRSRITTRRDEHVDAGAGRTSVVGEGLAKKVSEEVECVKGEVEKGWKEAKATLRASTPTQLEGDAKSWKEADTRRRV